MNTLTARIETAELLDEFLTIFDIPYTEDVKSIEIHSDLYDNTITRRKHRPNKKIKHKDSYYEAYVFWENMPEFVQPKQESFATIDIIVDIKLIPKLAIALNQSITNKTRSLRYPYKAHRREQRYVYIEESS